MAESLGAQLRQKLTQPLKFQWSGPGAQPPALGITKKDLFFPLATSRRSETLCVRDDYSISQYRIGFRADVPSRRAIGRRSFIAQPGSQFDILGGLMPTRILREGIITSEAVNSLSPTAELFYRRLMTVADDYGRYYAHPAILRGNCYPLQLDKVSDKDVSKWLTECVEKKLIILYGSGKYLQVSKFNQQCRSKSKFPEPVENELLINGISDDIHLIAEKNNVCLDTHTHTDSHSTLGGCGGGFKKPTIEEVKLLAAKSGLPDAEAVKFFCFYEANGWLVGKARNKMRSLAGAIGYWRSNWEERRSEKKIPDTRSCL